MCVAYGDGDGQNLSTAHGGAGSSRPMRDTSRADTSRRYLAQIPRADLRDASRIPQIFYCALHLGAKVDARGCLAHLSRAWSCVLLLVLAGSTVQVNAGSVHLDQARSRGYLTGSRRWQTALSRLAAQINRPSAFLYPFPSLNTRIRLPDASCGSKSPLSGSVHRGE